MPFVGIDILPLATTIFWIWMLLDCITNKKITGGSKVCWLLLIFFTNIVGAIIYFFMASSERNPITAFTYYFQQLAKFFKQNAPKPTPPPQSYPYREYQRPQPTSPPQSYQYPEYQQGYRPQSPIQNEQQQPPLYTPSKPEYEEQLTIPYPEMPQQSSPRPQN